MSFDWSFCPLIGYHVLSLVIMLICHIESRNSIKLKKVSGTDMGNPTDAIASNKYNPCGVVRSEEFFLNNDTSSCSVLFRL